MKRKLITVFLCTAVMMTGCAGQEDKNGRGEQEVETFDFADVIQDNDLTQKNESEENAAASGNQDSDIAEPSENHGNTSAPESQSQEADDNLQDAAATQDLYAGFIKNEVKAIVGDAYPQDEYKFYNLEGGESYTFAELGQYVNESYFDPEYSTKTSYDYAQYTYVKCADSDSRKLLIKFSGLGIYSPDDDSFAVYVVTEKNGQLYLTDMYECWARSYTEAYKNGLLASGGSGGAGDHLTGVSAILSDGKQADVYNTEILDGWWTSYVSGEIYNEVFRDSPDTALSVMVHTIGDNKLYTYDMSECTADQISLVETYVNRCRDEAGINWVTDAEVEAAIKERCAQLGISYDAMKQQEVVEWTNI